MKYDYSGVACPSYTYTLKPKRGSKPNDSDTLATENLKQRRWRIVYSLVAWGLQSLALPDLEREMHSLTGLQSDSIGGYSWGLQSGGLQTPATFFGARNVFTGIHSTGGGLGGYRLQPPDLEHAVLSLPLRNIIYPVSLARTFLLFFGRPPKSGFGHEADCQTCYGRKNTGKFGVSAIRIQWTTSRTKLRPKSSKKV